MEDLQVSNLKDFAMIFLAGVAAGIIMALLGAVVRPVERVVTGTPAAATTGGA